MSSSPGYGAVAVQSPRTRLIQGQVLDGLLAAATSECTDLNTGETLQGYEPILFSSAPQRWRMDGKPGEGHLFFCLSHSLRVWGENLQNLVVNVKILSCVMFGQTTPPHIQLNNLVLWVNVTDRDHFYLLRCSLLANPLSFKWVLNGWSRHVVGCVPAGWKGFTKRFRVINPPVSPGSVCRFPETLCWI